LVSVKITLSSNLANFQKILVKFMGDSKPIKNLGVFTSGGDAPGMNAAIRAVVRGGLYHGLNIWGIERGFEGMLENDFISLGNRSVGNILQKGGTILKTARSEIFKTAVGMEKAYHKLLENDIDALIGIGGNGSLTGLKELNLNYNVPVMGIPASIDNDLGGTDYSIGFDSATNTVVDGVDKIRDTALSHNRLFLIEVMGRDSGQIAVQSGIASGAISIVIPEKEKSMEDLFADIRKLHGSKKESKIIIVAEGGGLGSAPMIADQITTEFPHYEVKVTILGHLQRGGAPTTFDRVLASKLGVAAVEGMINGHRHHMVGLKDNKLVFTPLEESLSSKNPLPAELLRISEFLSN
jgi:6-phosphofructokinase 1